MKRDIFGIEQFVACLCWVNKNCLVNKDLISLVDVEQTNSTTLTEQLKLLLSVNDFVLQIVMVRHMMMLPTCLYINGVAQRILNV